MNLQALLRAHAGLDLDEADLERALRQRMQLLGLSERADYLAGLAGAELQALLELVVVPESWLFRDPGAFALLVRHVQQHAGPARRLRLLSLPCANGEEPYSMAMALVDAGVPPAWFSIEGVDLSQEAIARARRAVFPAYAFRGGDAGLRARHFAEVAGGYQLAPQIASLVNFRQGNVLNLHSDVPYDVIFCRNMLIYFDGASTAAALSRLSALLTPDGLLFVGHAELPALVRAGFQAVAERASFAVRKGGPAPLPPAPPPAPLATPAPVPRPAPALATPLASPPVPHAAGVRLHQAHDCLQRGQLAAAQAVCEAVLADAPDTADAHFLLGLVADGRADRNAAEQHWRACLYLEPAHYEALCHLALLASRRGDASAAAAWQRRATRVYARSHSGGGRA
ncbi:protein-glutamate O-methyltransferase CheR [Massilia sp. TS11]|uniref:CheR family methyltransferase n=1 Tax=Massilia sp. TS11 TaxID=2908003 RepID=UPI001EDB6D75|nr:protein-glutamate O-methyltransferase CheR [Massilia sp. TS11]MCG2586186.1 methyltransferase domain-containing protein [Massilia sp. TS11]